MALWHQLESQMPFHSFSLYNSVLYRIIGKPIDWFSIWLFVIYTKHAKARAEIEINQQGFVWSLHGDECTTAAGKKNILIRSKRFIDYCCVLWWPFFFAEFVNLIHKLPVI